MHAYAYASLGALLYVAGYPAGLGVWPLACVALAPLLGWLEHARPTPRMALAAGALFGVLTQLAGYAFLPETLLRFSGMPYLACVLAYGALCAAQAGGAALWSWGLSWLGARGYGVLAWAPPLWVAHELLWPSVFEAPLGAALHDVPALVQGAELGGVALVSLLVAAMNAALAGLALALARRRAADGRRAALALALIAAAAGLSCARFTEAQRAAADAPALRLGLVQASLDAEAKRRDPRAYAERYRALSNALAQDAQDTPIDLLLWPETALASPVPGDVAAAADAQPSLAGLSAPLLTGAVVYERGRLYNSALAFDARGARTGRVDKRKLLPFAEAIPLGERFPRLYDLIPGTGRFTPGTRPAVTSALTRAGATQLAVFICYEDMLPGLVRRASPGAALLVSLSNDAWFGDSRAAFTHFAVARLRAVELRRTLARATNTGVTAVIDPSGALSPGSPLAEHAAGSLVARAPLLDTETPYARFGALPITILLALWSTLALRRPSLSARP